MTRSAGWNVVMGLALLLLGACSGGVTGVTTSAENGGPQEIREATEVVRFDPGTIAAGGGGALAGVCDASIRVPGAYRCVLEDNSDADPCLVVESDLLVCRPNPLDLSYGVAVRPTVSLPQIASPSIQQLVPFFVELEGGEGCVLRTSPEPVIIAGVPALYDCPAPFTYIVGFENSTPLWEAGVFTLDPATGESGGRVPRSVLRAWIP